MDISNYLFPCILMGVGIAIDVTIATLTKFKDQGLKFKTWTVPITGTHILFPAFGYYVFWWLGKEFPILGLLLGVMGFLLVSLFVYEVLCESIGVKPFFGISAWISRLAGLDESDTRRAIYILAVSWDALWSGFAKAAMATAGMWTPEEVFWSFFIAGAVVAVIAQLALVGAFWLRRVKFANPLAMARFNFWGKLLELSVIGGFGVLSLWQGVAGEGNLYWSIAIAFALLAVVFFIFWAELMENELSEATEAIE